MTQQALNLHVNPSEETIRLGPLALRFLLTGENSTGNIAVFELVVPGGAAPDSPAAAPRFFPVQTIARCTPRLRTFRT